MSRKLLKSRPFFTRLSSIFAPIPNRISYIFTANYPVFIIRIRYLAGIIRNYPVSGKFAIRYIPSFQDCSLMGLKDCRVGNVLILKTVLMVIISTGEAFNCWIWMLTVLRLLHADVTDDKYDATHRSGSTKLPCPKSYGFGFVWVFRLNSEYRVAGIYRSLYRSHLGPCHLHHRMLLSVLLGVCYRLRQLVAVGSEEWGPSSVIQDLRSVYLYVLCTLGLGLNF